MFVIGSATYSANAPGRWTPADRMSAEVPAAGHAVPAPTAHDVSLARDDVARLEVAYVVPHLDDLADELVPNDHRHRVSSAAPTRPRG